MVAHNTGVQGVLFTSVTLTTVIPMGGKKITSHRQINIHMSYPVLRRSRLVTEEYDIKLTFNSKYVSNWISISILNL